MTNELNMTYNSQREDLVIPEYGRNVQMLINYAKTIEDPAYRQAFVERLVRLMHQMHPQNKNIEDYIDKLWNHVFRIANFDLEVTPPNGIKPTPENVYKKPEKVEYPQMDTKYKHYGNNVQRLIEKALSMEKGPKRQAFVSVIGNYMKLAYKTWNKEHYVSDEIIKNDLESLSDGELVLKDNTSLDTLSNSNRRRKRPSNNQNNNRGEHRRRNSYHRKRK